MALVIKDVPYIGINSFRTLNEDYVDPRVLQSSDDGTVLRAQARSGRTIKFTASKVIASKDWPMYRTWFWDTCEAGLYPTRIRSYNGASLVVGWVNPPSVSHDINGSSTINFSFYQNSAWTNLT